MLGFFGVGFTQGSSGGVHSAAFAPAEGTEDEVTAQLSTATEQPYLSRRQNWSNQLSRHALMQPGATAIRFMGRTTTWAQFDHRVSKLADAFTRRGVRLGDRVMILMLNRPEFVEATVAASRIGAIAVQVNFRLTRPSWGFLVEDCQAAVMVTDNIADVATAVRDIAPALSTVIVAGGSTDAGVLGYEDLVVEEGTGHEPVDLPNESPALIMYTSGTTGRPKGAVLTHANLTAQAMTAMYTTSPDINNDVGFIGVPLFHIAGIGNMLGGLLLGTPTVIHPLGGFDPGELLDVLEAEGHRHLPGARPMAGRLRRTAGQAARHPAQGTVLGRGTGD